MQSFIALTGAVTALCWEATAAPIRVLIFASCGPSGYLHTIGQQIPQIKKLLLDPAGSRLQNPIIPPDGMIVDSLGVTTQNGTTEDGHGLVLALANHDVLVCANNTAFSGLFTTADQKAFLAWARAKGHGVIAYHGAADDNGNWPEKILYWGGKLSSHTAGIATVRSDTASAGRAEPDWKAINAGLADSNTMKDEWYSFQSQPRDIPGIRVLSTLDEATYDPAKRMGDHPISWYRVAPEGGRFYYTGAGHDWTYWRDSYWLRRQFYNAVVWAAGYTVPVSLSERGPAREGPRFLSGSPGGSLDVSVDRDGPHRIEIRDLGGRCEASARGEGRRTYSFGNLKANAVYVLLVTTPKERVRTLIRPR